MDVDHKFDLAIQLEKIDLARDILDQNQANTNENTDKWKQLGDLCLSKFKFNLAEECFWKCYDYSSLLLMLSCSGNKIGLLRLANESMDKGIFNIAFSAAFLAQEHEVVVNILLKSCKPQEASIYCRTYELPKKYYQKCLSQWNDDLQKINHIYYGKLGNPFVDASDEAGWKDEKNLVGGINKMDLLS